MVPAVVRAMNNGGIIVAKDGGVGPVLEAHKGLHEQPTVAVKEEHFLVGLVDDKHLPTSVVCGMGVEVALAILVLLLTLHPNDDFLVDIAKSTVHWEVVWGQCVLV